MKEHFLNYEQSLAVKELGFDELCMRLKNDIVDVYEEKSWCNWNGAKNLVSIPLKSQFFKWVRKKYGIDIHIGKNGEKALNLGSKKYVIFIETTSGINPSSTIFEDTYEQAEDALIDKIIELLKQKL